MRIDSEKGEEGAERGKGGGTETGGEAEAGREQITHSAEEGVAKKHARTDKSDTRMDTQAGGEANTSQSHSRHKKGCMTNIYLTDAHEKAIVDFIKDHDELIDKTNQQF